jgi:ribosomal protein S18 acetylase RimI-like enzyme
MPLTARMYADESDYARLRAFLVESWALSGPPAYCTVGDLDWWRFTTNLPDVMAGARLWQDEQGAVVGFTWPKPGNLDFFSHPRWRAIEAEQLDWAEARERETGGRELTTWSTTRDAERSALLTARGYTRGEAVFVNYARDLDDEFPPDTLPAGYTLRHVQGEADLPARVAVHRDAFAPSRMTVEKHRAVMASPTYRADLDLVVVAPDGSFAAYCLVWLDVANRHGLFEPVGCHSAHRQRGLAAAVVREGLRRLQALGATGATVLSHAASVPANRLYRSFGFQELDRDVAWRREL